MDRGMPLGKGGVLDPHLAGGRQGSEAAREIFIEVVATCQNYPYPSPLNRFWEQKKQTSTTRGASSYLKRSESDWAMALPLCSPSSAAWPHIRRRYGSGS